MGLLAFLYTQCESRLPLLRAASPNYCSFPPLSLYLRVLICIKGYLTYLLTCLLPPREFLERRGKVCFLPQCLEQDGAVDCPSLEAELCVTHHPGVGLCQQVFLGEESPTLSFLQGLQEGGLQVCDTDTSVHFGGKRRRQLRSSLGPTSGGQRQMQLLQGAWEQLGSWNPRNREKRVRSSEM